MIKQGYIGILITDTGYNLNDINEDLHFFLMCMISTSLYRQLELGYGPLKIKCINIINFLSNQVDIIDIK